MRAPFSAQHDAGSDAFCFPIAVIDFEATGLTLTGYPIEVGIAIARTVDSQIEVWSSLIVPAQGWDLEREWDPDAQRVHGISRRQLNDGVPAFAIMQQLNAMLDMTGPVWCDGGHYDQYWLHVLAKAAGTAPEFSVRDLGAALGSRPHLHEAYRAAIAAAGVAPHRAGPDARRICAAIAQALKAE